MALLEITCSTIGNSYTGALITFDENTKTGLAMFHWTDNGAYDESFRDISQGEFESILEHIGFSMDSFDNHYSVDISNSKLSEREYINYIQERFFN